MKKNMGSIDRIIRLLLAALLLLLYFTNVITGTVGLILVIVAVVFALTSLVSFCPLYTLLGFSTCKTERK